MYHYLDLDTYQSLKDLGVYFEVHANNLIKQPYNRYYEVVKTLMDASWIDFISSNSHDHVNQIHQFKDAYKDCLKRYGEKVTHKLFIENATKILL